MRSAIAASLALTFCVPPAFADEAQWELLSDEEGIKVWRREVEGSNFVEFRGKGVIGANMKQILAVLHDNKRKTEWMFGCVENKLVEAKSIGNVIIYNRTGSTFPLVNDRDTVVESKLTYSLEDRWVHIDAHAVTHANAPELDGVVRMPKLDLQWHLVSLGPNKTEATYQVAADPGGMLPAFVVNLVSRKVPFHTLNNLRKQTKKSYPHSLAVVEMAFDWSKVEAKWAAAAGGGSEKTVGASN